MKINKSFIISLTIFIVLCGLNLSLKNLKNKSKMDFDKEYVIREIFKLAVKPGTSWSANSPAGVCMEMLVSSQYFENQKKFWRDIENAFKEHTTTKDTSPNSPQTPTPSPYLMKNDILYFVHSSIGDSEVKVVDNGKEATYTCDKAISDNIVPQEKLQELAPKMKDLYNPGTKISMSAKEKIFVTAFTGVHRFTPEGRNLIPKLNGS